MYTPPRRPASAESCRRLPRPPSPRGTPLGAGNGNIGHMLYLCRRGGRPAPGTSQEARFLSNNYISAHEDFWNCEIVTMTTIADRGAPWPWEDAAARKIASGPQRPPTVREPLGQFSEVWTCTAPRELFSQVISIILQTWHRKKSLDSRGVSWRTISPDYAYGGRGFGGSNGILREDTIGFLCEEFFY